MKRHMHEPAPLDKKTIYPHKLAIPIAIAINNWGGGGGGGGGGGCVFKIICCFQGSEAMRIHMSHKLFMNSF
jgi:hypothetical protein